MSSKQNKIFSFSDEISSIIYTDFQTLCKIYKIIVNIELILGVIVSLLMLPYTHWLSFGYFGLFFFLSIIPQYILVEMGLLIDKMAKEQKKIEN